MTTYEDSLIVIHSLTGLQNENSGDRNLTVILPLVELEETNVEAKNQFLPRHCARVIAMVKLLFIVFLSVCCVINASPLNSLVIQNDADDIDSDNYDIIIDQRQNGTQNFRIKVSGLNIAIPDDRQHQSQSDSQPSLEQFASLLSPTLSASNSPHNMNVNDGLDDFADITAFFDWKKNTKTSDKKKSEDAQSRTKDIPTDAQLADDSTARIKEIVRDERRKYKLLVGEKYIMPILRFLKKQTEE